MHKFLKTLIISAALFAAVPAALPQHFCVTAEAAVKKGFVTTNGKTYYYDANGQKHKGWLTLNGAKYYFNKTTGVQLKGWSKNSKGQKIRYFTSKSGKMVTGFLTDSAGHTRYFDKSTGLLTRGWMKDSKGAKYYFTSGSGVMAKGWMQNSKGQKRYFSQTTGKMVTGWIKNSKGDFRFFDKSTGIMYTGLKEVESDLYYFSKTTGKRYSKGFLTVSNKKYYFNADGKAQKGWMNLDSSKYYFGKDGVMYKNTTATIGGVLYTFDSNGAASTKDFEVVGEDVKVYDAKNNRYYYMRKEYLEHEGIANNEVSDLDILAAVCESEAGDQGLVGMEAVALCVLNRTIEGSKCFPTSVRHVIYQTRPLQYEVVKNGALLKRLKGQYEDRASAYKAANEALKIFNAYIKNKTPRKLPGFDRDDFNFNYFMMEDFFYKQSLDFKKVDNFLYKDHMFFVDWISAPKED